jgi:ribulose-phosphate 3-epimerase
MIKCSTSLWSADLANLAESIRRVEAHTERFHLDVADGHYVPEMLFFPDLVKAIRKHTEKPFEVHLMTTEPLRWIEPFAAAGSNGMIFCFDSLKDPAEAFGKARSAGQSVGVSLMIHEPIRLLDPYWSSLDLVTIVGTEMGIKGASMDASIPDKIREAKAAIARSGANVEVELDGGIRRNTVPLMAEAGADWIVPGSLMFGDDPKSMREWLAQLG